MFVFLPQSRSYPEPSSAGIQSPKTTKKHHTSPCFVLFLFRCLFGQTESTGHYVNWLMHLFYIMYKHLALTKCTFSQQQQANAFLYSCSPWVVTPTCKAKSLPQHTLRTHTAGTSHFTRPSCLCYKIFTILDIRDKIHLLWASDKWNWSFSTKTF